MIIVVAIAILIMALLLNLGSGATITAADQRKGREAAERQRQNINRLLDETAKKQNVYYNHTCQIFEKDFNYDGSPKHSGAKRLPHG